jgi:FAD/FMN-containing dehydrogenase
VVKNVAGYDLTKLMAGGFGAFGVLTELNLRLRAAPELDRTLLARGGRDALSSAGRDLAQVGDRLGRPRAAFSRDGGGRRVVLAYASPGPLME